MNYYLYQYTNKESNKSYIGMTYDLEERHKRHINGRGGARTFYNAIRNYGIDAFDFRVLAIYDNKEEAARIEQAAIKTFGTLIPDGYNLVGGSPCTIYAGRHSKETCAKISDAHKGKKRPPPSAEWRQKISDSLKGHPVSLETRKKFSERVPWNKGKKRSLEHQMEFAYFKAMMEKA